MGRKTSPSPWGTWTPSNTPIPEPTPLTTPNGIQIESAVHPLHRQTHRSTGGIGNKPVPIPAYALLQHKQPSTSSKPNL